MRLLLALALLAILFGCVEVADDTSPSYNGSRQIAVQPPQLSFNNTPKQFPAGEGFLQNISPQMQENLTQALLPAIIGAMGNGSNSPPVSYYYSPNCPYCERLRPLIEKLSAEFGNGSIGSINVLTGEGFTSFDKALSSLNVSQRVVPFVVAGNRTLVGIDEINSSLEELLYNLSNQSGMPR